MKKVLIKFAGLAAVIALCFAVLTACDVTESISYNLIGEEKISAGGTWGYYDDFNEYKTYMLSIIDNPEYETHIFETYNEDFFSKKQLFIYTVKNPDTTKALSVTSFKIDSDGKATIKLKSVDPKKDYFPEGGVKTFTIFKPVTKEVKELNSPVEFA